MVADDAVGVATLDHVVRDVGLGAVDESCDHVARAIQLGDGVELVLIQEALCEGAVDSLADPAVLAIDHIVDGHAAGELDMQQVAKDVIGIVRGGATVGFAL